MDKRRPVGRLVVCNRDGEKKYKSILALWPGKYGQTFTIDGRITRDEWTQIYDDFQAKKLWGNVYEDDGNSEKDAPF